VERTDSAACRRPVFIFGCYVGVSDSSRSDKATEAGIRSTLQAGDVGAYKIAAASEWHREADQRGDGGVSDQTPITWLEYTHMLAMSIVLAAAGTAVFYGVVHVLP
jgi:hypothetical protein